MGPVPEPEVTLFDIKYSPYSQRVHIALEEKGISYKCIQVDPRNKPQLLVESNPIHQKIPTIIHNGNAVAESLVILEYLEEEWPHQVTLMPKDAFEKSKVRFWADYLYKSAEKGLDTCKQKAGSPVQVAAREEAVKVLKTVETAMISFSAEGPFFTGEAFGYLDVVYAPLGNFLFMAEKNGGLVVPGPDELPRFHRWMGATMARPSVSSVLPSKEETVAFFTLPPEARAKAFAENAAASSQ